MVVEQENTGSGFPYADCLIIHLRWEVHQPTPTSERCALRHSYQIDYAYKPWGVAGLLKETADSKVKEAVKYLMSDFFPQVAEEYHSILLEGTARTKAAPPSKMSLTKNEVRLEIELATQEIDEKFEEHEQQLNMMSLAMAACLLFLLCLCPVIMNYRRLEQKVEIALAERVTSEDLLK